MVKCGESETPEIIDIIVPFSSRPDMNEEIVVKTDARQEIPVENLKIIKDVCTMCRQHRDAVSVQPFSFTLLLCLYFEYFLDNRDYRFI